MPDKKPSDRETETPIKRQDRSQARATNTAAIIRKDRRPRPDKSEKKAAAAQPKPPRRSGSARSTLEVIVLAAGVIVIFLVYKNLTAV